MVYPATASTERWQVYPDKRRLDYPEDLEKFSEVFFKFTDENESLNQLFKSLIEAFPEKRESILSVPIYVDDEDGNSIRVTLDLED